MKLVDFIVDLESRLSAREKPERMIGDALVLDSSFLRKIEPKLFECDEFKNVARLNYVDCPTYLVDEETGEPIITNREFLGGKTISKQVDSYLVNPGQELKFNKIVDLYSISLNRRYLLKEEISKHGVWVYPTSYDEKTFEPTNKIVVIWDPNQLRDALAMVGNSEKPNDRLKRMFDTALEKMTPNVPCEYVLSLRCSQRSISNYEEISKEIQENLLKEPGPVPGDLIASVDGDGGPK